MKLKKSLLILLLAFGLLLSFSASSSSLGKFIDMQKQNDGVMLRFEHGLMKISKLTDAIIRVRATDKDAFEPDESFAIWEKAPRQKPIKIKESHSELIFQTGLIKGKISKQNGAISVYEISGRLLMAEPEEGGIFFESHKPKIIRKILDGEHYYGFGEKTGPFDKKGEKMIMWNTDQIYNTHTDPIYQSHPFYLVLKSGASYGIFYDNTYRSVFDVGASRSERLVYKADGGEVNYYFIYGPEPKKVIERYSSLVGRYPIPPLWAIGYHQCRYSYRNEHKVRRIANKFRKYQIPCDCIYLDIHYLDNYKVFTFHPQRFPEPKKLLDELEAMGFKTIAIIDPGVKIEPGYFVYEQGIKGDYFVRDKNGGYFKARVWPGDVYFPDFLRPEVRRWWGDLHKILIDAGVDGIWNDMNEPAGWVKDIRLGSLMVPFGKPNWLDMVHGEKDNPVPHAKIHNVYALLEAQATYDGLKRHLSGKRPFMISRAGYPGIQRYSSIWTGDNFANWRQLKMTPAMLLNMGISGLVMVGADIGGFTGVPSGELYIRWLQQGVFYPFCRTHTAVYHPSQDPFSYGRKVREASKKAIELRYRLLPYTYSYFRVAYEKGLPVMRALFLEFPDDEKTYNISSEFMWGEWILVAPVMKEKASQWRIYLPQGSWFKFESSEKIAGGKDIILPVSLDTIPIFVKEGAIIPLAPVMNYTGEKPWAPLTVQVYPSSQKTCFELYEDDGKTLAYEKGEYLKTTYCQQKRAEEFVLEKSEGRGNFSPVKRELVIKIYGADEPKEVNYFYSGQSSKLNYQYFGGERILEIRLSDTKKAFKIVVKEK